MQIEVDSKITSLENVYGTTVTYCLIIIVGMYYVCTNRICPCVCVCMYICVCISVCVCMCVYSVCVCISVCVYVSLCVCMYLRVCVCVYLRVCMYVCVYVCVVYVFAYMCVCVVVHKPMLYIRTNLQMFNVAISRLYCKAIPSYKA